MQDMLMLKAQKKLVGFISIFAIAVSILTIFLLAHPVAADTYAPDSSGNCKSSSDTKTTSPTGATVCQTATTTAPGAGQAGQGSTQTSTDNATTCAIEKMGWILCPVIETTGKIGDQAFEQLSKHFLETEPELVASFTGGPNKPGTYVAWELARNIANVMFIIAFLIIIFSQVTGRGIDNYGIKKLLPKLIIAAIAVNVSYYICQAMVDITNILGYSIENFMVDTAKQVSDKVAMPPQTGIDVQTSHGTLGTIALGVLAVAGIVWFLLPILFLGISTVVIACLVIIVILLMRKAFIVLLVVASPIAFVFYLLPNTERLFQKWLKMFWQLLMVFPIVGILFGGGQLASAIILIAGTNSTTDAQAASTGSKSVYSDGGTKCIQLPSWPQDNPAPSTTGGPVQQTADSGAKVGDCGAKSTPFMLGLVAAGVAVAPLFAVWAVLKGALSAAGTIGGKISGAVQNAGSKASKRGDDLEKRLLRQPLKQGIATSALNGGFGKRTGAFVRRRQLAGKRREEMLKAAQEGFDARDGGGADISQDILAARQAGNAAQKGLRDKFIQSQLNDKNYVGNALGKSAEDDEIKNALIIQQTQARSEAQRDIEARLDPANLELMGDQLINAFKAANEVEVRAISNQLWKAGAEGQNQFRRAAGKAVTENYDSQNHMAEALRQEMQANNPGYKNQDWALGKWGEGTGGDDLAGIFRNDADPSIYGSMTPAAFASQAKARQVDAVRVMSSSKAGLAQINQIKSALAKSPTEASKLDNSIRQSWGI
jgi:hypothetical protein